MSFTIVTDCDGILTTPYFTYNATGKAEKHFYVNDSITMRLLKEKHRDIIDKIIILTGDGGPGFQVVQKRVEDLQLGDFVELYHCGNESKANWLNTRYRMSESNFSFFYFGDDLPDAEIFDSVGQPGQGCCAIGTTDAAPECLQRLVRAKMSSTAYVAPHQGAFTNLVENLLINLFDRSLLSTYVMRQP
jgi:3-deoxy-D-manno-octulosonate 8-phosphate phosphatase KdsC-like HAD superfamily phosphatase